VARPV